MAVNFHGTVDLIFAVLPHMIEQGSGHLVFVSTFDARFGNRNEGPYVASKHAQAGFAEVARRELASLGVTATTVLLGRVDTPMIDHLRVSPIQPKVGTRRAADVVVRAVERRPAQIVFPPVRGRLLLFVNTMFPGLNDRLSKWLHLEGWDQPDH
jgi:NAD(P)-dependent dehydrogenase (short-subunit alcohol dehydrogenase family)